ncbi:thermonuclease family protein [uncultured Phyllobacterium sp.]|uniref:thermonuclease family protein n=1 Tax=uncultured Phyllobacterium sp. TaxID=253813 RepID=UPI00258F0A04|nr:thermonuclease family protein [uncultured Phyllobacterium sp.]
MNGRFGRYRRRWQRPAAAPRPLARKLADYLLMLVFFALVALLAARLSVPREVREITGKAYVIDGDTVVVTGQHVRLKGIDAPELAQRCGKGQGDYACGQEARQALVRLIGGRPVRCETSGRDKYRRDLGTCFAGDADLNRAMVETGQAVAYGDYRDAEMQARTERKGLWKSSFDRPQDWRKLHQQDAETAPEARNRLADIVNGVYDWVRQKLGEIW